MASTNTLVYQTRDVFIMDCLFVAADVSSGATAHSLGDTPKEIYFTVLVTGVTVSDWAIAVTSTTFTLTKTLVAAGNTGNVRVILKRPIAGRFS